MWMTLTGWKHQQLVVGCKRRFGRHEIRLGGSRKIVGQLFGTAGDEADALGW